MSGTVWKGRALADDDLCTAAYAAVYAQLVVDIAIDRHSEVVPYDSNAVQTSNQCRFCIFQWLIVEAHYHLRKNLAGGPEE